MSSPQPPHPHFTEPTTHYWQSILPAPSPASSAAPPYQFRYPAPLPDSRILMLPIRPLATNPQHAVASLLVNQASMSVVAELGRLLAEKVGEAMREAGAEVEVVIGVPTLGLSVAGVVAGEMGFGRYVPLGYSRKFWYDDELSAEVSSVTSPGVGLKRVYLDPHQLLLVKGKRAVIIDDAVSSGRTLKATWDLLERIGCVIEGCGVVMRQGEEWRMLLGDERAEKVVGVLESPLLRVVDGGWDLR